jgi:hypothetical protein
VSEPNKNNSEMRHTEAEIAMPGIRNIASVCRDANARLSGDVALGREQIISIRRFVVRLWR